MKSSIKISILMFSSGSQLSFWIRWKFLPNPLSICSMRRCNSSLRKNFLQMVLQNFQDIKAKQHSCFRWNKNKDVILIGVITHNCILKQVVQSICNRISITSLLLGAELGMKNQKWRTTVLLLPKSTLIIKTSVWMMRSLEECCYSIIKRRRISNIILVSITTGNFWRLFSAIAWYRLENQWTHEPFWWFAQ